MIIEPSKAISQKCHEDVFIKEQFKEKESLILNSIQDAYLLSNESGGIVDCNNVACGMLKYSKSELLKKKISTVEALRPITKFIPYLYELIEEGQKKILTKYMVKNRQLIDVEVTLTYWKSKKLIIGISRNISKQILLKEQLLKTTAHLNSLSENLKTIVDMDPFILSKNSELISEPETSTVYELINQIQRLNSKEQFEILNTLQKEIKGEIPIKKKVCNDFNSIEAKVSQLIVEGYTSKEIANMFRVSNRTIENYRQSIREKLHIRNTSKNLKETLINFSQN